jgi:hypothetical protein
MNSYPRLPAYPYPLNGGGTGLRVWCCWCDSWHKHGGGYGHRAAHCAGESPYRPGGYILADPAEVGRAWSSSAAGRFAAHAR